MLLVTSTTPAHLRKPVALKSFVFNGGEVQVSLNVSDVYNSNQYHITAFLETSDHIMELLMVTEAIKQYDKEAAIHLTCPYFPYARQDRVMQEGEALSVKVMADLINSQGYKTVTIWDAHSDVTPALVNNSINKHVKELVSPIFRGRVSGYVSYDNTILVAPDAGSIKKVSAVAKEFSMSMVRADKHRDVKTGQITETIVYSDHVGDMDFLIIDDICDGGRTFVELAAKLKEKTNGKISLYVTHGIFSNGVKVFKDKIDKIYCANVFSKVEEHPLLVRV